MIKKSNINVSSQFLLIVLSDLTVKQQMKNPNAVAICSKARVQENCSLRPSSLSNIDG